MGDGSLNFEAWKQEVDVLPGDDAQWLLVGIRDGFRILNDDERGEVYVETENYTSSTCIENKARVEKQILAEIENKRYRLAPEKPIITSAIGAVKKSGGGIRLIHDASRPEGLSLNDMWAKEPFKYTSLQDGIDLIKKDSYMGKIDLESAFRSVKLHPSNFMYTGLKWTFENETQPRYLIDTRLPFGARRSPFIFNSLTQTVCRIMKNNGYQGIIAYADDFLVVQDSYAECQDVMNALMRMLRKLGFAINYKKVEGPAQSLPFLGITLDSRNMTLSLPQEKLDGLSDSLRKLVNKSKVTKRELQSIAGKLCFATQCIYGGRYFLQRIHDQIAKLSKPWHRCRVNQAVEADAVWWLKFLRVFNGTMNMIDSRPLTPMYTDACPVACGGVFLDQFVYFPFKFWEEARCLSINLKETLAAEVALYQWAEKLRDKKVLLHIDNQAAVAIINRGSSRNPVVMQSLRRIFWLSCAYNFRLTAVYYPGSDNRYADAISRLHEGPQLLNRLNKCPIFFQDPTVYGIENKTSTLQCATTTASATPHPHAAPTKAITARTSSFATSTSTPPYQPNRTNCAATPPTSQSGFATAQSSST